MSSVWLKTASAVQRRSNRSFFCRTKSNLSMQKREKRKKERGKTSMKDGEEDERRRRGDRKGGEDIYRLCGPSPPNQGCTEIFFFRRRAASVLGLVWFS